MYEDLGLGWAGSIPAFLTLVCVPVPYLFWRYGAAIRQKCKYSAEAAAFLEKIREGQAPAPVPVARPRIDDEEAERVTDVEKKSEE